MINRPAGETERGASWHVARLSLSFPLDLWTGRPVTLGVINSSGQEGLGQAGLAVMEIKSASKSGLEASPTRPGATTEGH